MNIITLLQLLVDSGAVSPKAPTESATLKKRREFIELGLKRPDQWYIMEIDAYTLLAYAIIWTVFYFFLSHYIAELSRKRWTNWIQSEDSDEILMEALEVIVNEIEDRMHDKLEQFQSSFFGSLGAASKKLDNATGASTIKALTKDNPLMGFVAEYMMKRGNLGALQGENSLGNVSEKPKESDKLGLKQSFFT